MLELEVFPEQSLSSEKWEFVLGEWQEENILRVELYGVWGDLWGITTSC